jgi:hypothetical protein
MRVSAPSPHTLAPLPSFEYVIQRHVDAAIIKKPPSEGARPSNYPAVQAKGPILNGRPFTTRAAPVYLYHPVFANFKHRFNDKTLEVPTSVQQQVYPLCVSSADVYDTTMSLTGKRVAGETIRKSNTRRYYQLLLEPFADMNLGSFIPNGGIITLLPDGTTALRALVEEKNEIGAGGCDPNLQGSLSYAKYWAQSEVRIILFSLLPY